MMKSQRAMPVFLKDKTLIADLDLIEGLCVSMSSLSLRLPLPSSSFSNETSLGHNFFKNKYLCLCGFDSLGEIIGQEEKARGRSLRVKRLKF